MIDSFLRDLTAIRNLVIRGRAVNLNDRSSKEKIATLTKSYFEKIRPAIVEKIGEHPNLALADGDWQKLLLLTHGNNSRAGYKRVLGRLGKHLAGLDVAVSVGDPRLDHSTSPQELLLLETLQQISPTSRMSYEQGVKDLADSARISYRGTAGEFREALRETLDMLAPDHDVMKQPGFKLEIDRSGPTMKQKVRYVFNSRARSKAERDAAERTANLVDELTGDVTRAIYNRASVALHIQRSREEVLRIKRYVDTVLFDLLELGSHQ